MLLQEAQESGLHYSQLVSDSIRHLRRVAACTLGSKCTSVAVTEPTYLLFEEVEEENAARLHDPLVDPHGHEETATQSTQSQYLSIGRHSTTKVNGIMVVPALPQQDASRNAPMHPLRDGHYNHGYDYEVGDQQHISTEHGAHKWKPFPRPLKDAGGIQAWG